jgi:hypothetical protein
MSQVKITVRPNGPYRVEDPDSVIELVDVDGNKYDLTGKTMFSLCQPAFLRRNPQDDSFSGSRHGDQSWVTRYPVPSSQS